MAGTPASGKTSFGDYLRDKKHFLHVDIEAFHGSYFHSVWDAAVRAGDVSLFLNALEERSAHTVLSWGFHPDDVEIVADFKRAGVKLWWFDADETRARERFVARGSCSINAFEAQMKRIRDNRRKIEQLFQPNILTTLKPDNGSMTFPQIFDLVRRAG